MRFCSNCAVFRPLCGLRSSVPVRKQTRLKLAAVAPESPWTNAAALPFELAPRRAPHILRDSPTLKHSASVSPEMATVVPMPLPAGELPAAASPLDSKRNNARVDLSMLPAEVSEAQLT